MKVATIFSYLVRLEVNFLKAIPTSEVLTRSDK